MTQKNGQDTSQDALLVHPGFNFPVDIDQSFPIGGDAELMGGLFHDVEARKKVNARKKIGSMGCIRYNPIVPQLSC